MSTSGINGSPQSLVSTPADSGPESSILKQLQSDAPKIHKKDREDTTDFGTQLLSTNLSVLAQQVLDKLNEIIGKDIPGGISNLKPDDHTPEKTAQRIVDGVTGLFAVFAQQNKGLAGEELLTKFMETIRGGIQTGYGQADAILGDAGAFDLPGVKDGIEETKRLVEEKLKAFEESYRKQLNGGADSDKKKESNVDESAKSGTSGNAAAGEKSPVSVTA